MNNRIRFSAWDGATLVAQTDWTPERTRDCALNLLTSFRQQYNGLAYTIERTGDSKTPNLHKLIRVTIKDGADTYYSREFEEHEAVEQLASIRIRWPKAEITVKERYG